MSTRATKLRKQITKTVINIITVFAFFAILGYTLLNAYGYRIDANQVVLVSTGLLDLRDIKEKYSIYLGDELSPEKTPTMLNELDVKKTNLTLSKDGYYDWSKKIKISSRIITSVPTIRLIPVPDEENTEIISENIKSFDLKGNQIALLDTNDKIFFVNNPTEIISTPEDNISDIYFCNNSLCITGTTSDWILNPDDTWTKTKPTTETPLRLSPNGKQILTTTAREIFIKPLSANTKDLIARYASGLDGADWYSENQLIIDRNGKLTITDLDGKNATYLTDHSGKFLYENHKLYYIQNGELKVLDTK